MEGAELACVVLSLENQPELPGAVRSLVEQSPRPEIVVVNSGGGDPAAAMRTAGLEVPVVSRQERLLPGGARNLGIEATTAPYVAFLAADCRAEPGWVSGRLNRHRDGAAAVGSLITNPDPASPAARASHLLLHPRRLAHTAPAQRLLYGLSYDRALFERHGRFREDLRDGEDSDFNARLGEEARIVWAEEVRTSHRNPLRARDLVVDQYRRSRRSAARDGLPVRVVLPAVLLRRPLFALRQGLRTPDKAEWRGVVSASPLVFAGALGHTCGWLVRRIRDGR
jgi:glycosyltransferase involved in cell wall biosynthesis